VLGCNNPVRNGTLVSLRLEFYRVRTDQTTANDKNLRKQILQSRVKSNVLNDSVVLKNFSNISKDNGGAVPGIVIPFSTVSQRG